MRSEEFDNKVKSLFDEREIRPSAAAWDKLEAKLGEAEQEQSSGRWYWYVAASVIAVILLASGLLVNSTPQDIENTVAGQKAEPEIIESSREIVPEALQEGVAEQVPEEIPAPREIRVMQKQVTTGKAPMQKVADREVHTIVEKLEPVREMHYIPVVSADEVVEVTDREIDDLLTMAKARLAEEGSDNGTTVSATALLEDVEDELDQNFKDKALDALKKGFVKLRSAVAERNE